MRTGELAVGDAAMMHDLEESYRNADRRLRDLLFGDGVYSAGQVRGEEVRGLVANQLRHMREAFDAATRQGEAVNADLEEELRKLASHAVAEHTAVPNTVPSESLDRSRRSSAQRRQLSSTTATTDSQEATSAQ